jgi:hypothetical protein
MYMFFDRVPGFIRNRFEDWIAEEIKSNLQAMAPESKTASASASSVMNESFITHIYSNNGAWVYGSLCRRALIPRPSLVVWDASPSLWYDPDAPVTELAAGLCRVFVSNLLRGPIYTHPILTPIGTFFLSCFISLSMALAKIQGSYHIVPDMVKMNLYLRDQSPIIPSVFIYSTGDRLIPKEVIQEFITALRGRGVPIVEKIFGDEVSHTGSFYLKPEEYMDFLKPYLGNPSKVGH